MVHGARAPSSGARIVDAKLAGASGAGPSHVACSVQMDLHPLIDQRLQLVRFLAAEEPTEGLRR